MDEIDALEAPSEAPDLRVQGLDGVCAKRPFWVVNDADPEDRFPQSCDAYRCETCGPRKALACASLAAWAIRQAPRGRFTSLTLAPEEWVQRRQKVRDLRRLLERRGYAWEMAWTTERGSRNGMVHVHGLQHGDYVPQRVLQEVWGARVDIRKVETGGVARYVTKDALKVAGYTVKGSTATPGSHHAFLDLNGGRAMHWSRGFLHGKTKREAQQALRLELGSEDTSWHLEPAFAVHTGELPRGPRTEALDRRTIGA